MKRRKVENGKKSNLQFFRKKLIKFIENWELDDLIGGSVYSGTTCWTNAMTDKYEVDEIVKMIIEKNKSEKFRKVLMKKKEINNDLRNLYKTYLLSKRNEVPSLFKDRVFHLVHYFYHGSIPLDKTLKSASTLRKEEKEVINEYGNEMTDFVDIDLGEKLPRIPRDVFWEILKFIPHDYDHLCRIGLVNEKFFISFLQTWEHVSILSPTLLRQVSLLVLKNCREISLCHYHSDDNEDDEGGGTSSKGRGRKDHTYNFGNLKYLYENITESRIVTLDLSDCEQETSYFNIVKSIYQERMVFPNMRNLHFMYVPFKKSYAETDDPELDFFDAGPYHIKRQAYSFSFKTGNHNFCPNLRKVKNASVESLMLIPRSQHEKLESLRLYLYKKDANVLNECNYDFPSCETFEIYPREILKSSYVERVFEKISFSSGHLRKLGVSVSSDDDTIIFNDESQSKIEHLKLDFRANFAKGERRPYMNWGRRSTKYHTVESPKVITFDHDHSDENMKNSLRRITISNYPIKTEKRKPKFMTSLKKQFKADGQKTVEEVELQYRDYEKDRDQPVDYWDDDDDVDETRKYWECPFFKETTTFSKYYMKDIVSKMQVFKYRYVTLKFLVVSQTIEVWMEGRENVVNNDILYMLSSLSKCVKSKSGSLKDFKFVKVVYSAHPFCLFIQRKSLRRFLEEYFPYCDISIEYDDDVPIIQPKKKKKKKKKKPKNDLLPLKGCKICISQIGNPERREIREAAVKLGASYAPQFDTFVTHMIVPDKNASRNADKVVSALDHPDTTVIVEKEWVYECERNKRRCDEDNFTLFSSKKKKKKIMMDEDEDDESTSSSESEEEEEESPKIKRNYISKKDLELYGPQNTTKFVVVLKIFRNRKEKTKKGGKKKKQVRFFVPK